MTRAWKYRCFYLLNPYQVLSLEKQKGYESFVHNNVKRLRGIPIQIKNEVKLDNNYTLLKSLSIITRTV